MTRAKPNGWSGRSPRGWVCRSRCSCSSCLRTGWAGFSPPAFLTDAESGGKNFAPVVAAVSLAITTAVFTVARLRCVPITAFRQTLPPQTRQTKRRPDRVEGGAALILALIIVYCLLRARREGRCANGPHHPDNRPAQARCRYSQYTTTYNPS